MIHVTDDDGDDVCLTAAVCILFTLDTLRGYPPQSHLHLQIDLRPRSLPAAQTLPGLSCF